MFRQFVVRNFRGFAGVQLKDLARINLIAGKNNTGKTALLEAIHLHNNPTRCDIALRLNERRFGANGEDPDFDTVEWLFHGKHPEVGFEVSSYDETGVNRTLSGWVLPAALSRDRFPEMEEKLRGSFGAEVTASDSPRVILRYEQAGTAPSFSVALRTQFGHATSNARIPWDMPGAFIGSMAPRRKEDVEFFGRLEVSKRQDEIMPALRVLEPRLTRLALIPMQDEPVIHGDIGLPLMLPVPFMGEGLRRLLSMVLAIAVARDGVVLIDEIENGLHYSVQKQVWRAVARAARQNNVQVFATTHSWECLVKAHEAFADDDVYDLRWHRLQEVRGEIQAVSHDREMIEAALYSGVELR